MKDGADATENDCEDWNGGVWIESAESIFIFLGSPPMKDWTVYRITANPLWNWLNKSDS